MASGTSASPPPSTARSVCGASFSNSARPNGLPTYRPTNSRSGSNSNKSALKFCKGSLDHAQRAFCKTILAKVLFRHPFHAARVARGGRLTAQTAAQIVDQNVMIFGLSFRVLPACIRHNPLEDFKNRVGRDLQPGVFGHLAADCLLQLLTRFDNSTGDGPITFERFLAALHQQNLSVFENQRTNPQERARWISPALRVNKEFLSRPAARDTPSFAR